mgnify:FL=1
MKHIYKELLLMVPWFIFVIVWNYNWPTAIPFDDGFVTICLYFFNRSCVTRLK